MRGSAKVILLICLINVLYQMFAFTGRNLYKLVTVPLCSSIPQVCDGRHCEARPQIRSIRALFSLLTWATPSSSPHESAKQAEVWTARDASHLSCLANRKTRTRNRGSTSCKKVFLTNLMHSW